MVVTGTYTGTDTSAMWDQVAPQLGARLEPVQKIVETGFAIDSALIGGLTTIGSVGGATLGLGTKTATSVAPKAITITTRGLQHVLERHAAGGARTAGKSSFNALAKTLLV